MPHKLPTERGLDGIHPIYSTQHWAIPAPRRETYKLNKIELHSCFSCIVTAPINGHMQKTLISGCNLFLKTEATPTFFLESERQGPLEQLYWFYSYNQG